MTDSLETKESKEKPLLTPDSVGALAVMCNDFSKIIKPLPTAEIRQQAASIENTVQTNLTYLTEFSSTVESVRNSSKKASTTLIPKLIDRAQQVKDLYAKIDAYQLYLDKLEESVNKMEARIDMVDKAYGGNVVTKLFSSLSGFFDDSKKKHALCLEWQPINFIVKTSNYFDAQDTGTATDDGDSEMDTTTSATSDDIKMGSTASSSESTTSTTSTSATSAPSTSSTPASLTVSAVGEAVDGEGDEEEEE